MYDREQTTEETVPAGVSGGDEVEE